MMRAARDEGAAPAPQPPTVPHGDSALASEAAGAGARGAHGRSERAFPLPHI
jgi:hypothetical protein